MRVMIDALDGAGSLDCSRYILFDGSSCIVRELNKPSTCKLSILAGVGGISAPPVSSKVQIVNSANVILFTGYVDGSRTLAINGVSSGQESFFSKIVAVSDEVILDAVAADVRATFLGQSAYQNWMALEALTSVTPQLALSAQQVAASRLDVAVGTSWSKLAGLLASSTRSAYKCLSGVVETSVVGSVSHQVASDDPGLQLESDPLTDSPYQATDLVVYGEKEPGAYVTEVFAGDGITSTFTLSQKPFAPNARQKSALLDTFQGNELNKLIWQTIDPGAQIALTSAGLTCNGGSGRDAETTVSTIQQVEIGGSLTFEASGVQIASGSSGIMLGLYVGLVSSANCFSGFQIGTQGGSTQISSTINGVIAGTSFTAQPNQLYTLRMRVLSPEMERIRQSYAGQQGTGVFTSGGDVVDSSGQIELEVQTVTDGLPSAPIILYSGVVSSLPPACSIGLLNSGNLTCSIESISCVQAGPLSISVGTASSQAMPQFIGLVAEGGTCHVTDAGVLSFYPTAIPSSGNLIFVRYRAANRAVSRRVVPSVLPALGGAPIAWLGTVEEPTAWSSVDCDNAILAIESSRCLQPLLRGTYRCTALPNQADIWPGDELSIGPQEDGSYYGVLVRRVTISLNSGCSDAQAYLVQVANDGVEAVSIHLSSSVPDDTEALPLTNTQAGLLASVVSLCVVEVTTGSITLDTGMQPPLNGGFEVRRRDQSFGAGINSDLVLRTAATRLSIPRSSAMERYYVRAFDSAEPPNYSAYSSAILLYVQN